MMLEMSFNRLERLRNSAGGRWRGRIGGDAAAGGVARRAAPAHLVQAAFHANAGVAEEINVFVTLIATRTILHTSACAAGKFSRAGVDARIEARLLPPAGCQTAAPVHP